ncbi:MAG: hypothetical protein HND48_09815 [Chloroflexi bacterium]|nr:hypothetical protein [Chloroflexota bacterium]
MDVHVVVYDGKMHPVDLKDIAFQIAGREAFKEAFHEAGPVLQEPIMDVKITVPEAMMGDIMSDLNTRRGRVQRHGHDRDGQERGQRADPAGRDAALQQRFALNDWRTGYLRDDVLTLRPRAVEHRRANHQGVQATRKFRRVIAGTSAHDARPLDLAASTLSEHD